LDAPTGALEEVEVRTNRSVRGVSIVGVFSTLLTVILLGSGEGRTKEETVRSTGTELVAVFIASSTCGGITDPRLEPGLGRAMNVLAEDARLQGHRFIRVGIALDPDPEAGLDVLNRFGPFDELYIGGEYLNAGALNYLDSGALAIPQLVVVRRDVRVTGGLMAVASADVIMRKVGADQIDRWSQVAVASLGDGTME
jgi:hypothetical protein